MNLNANAVADSLHAREGAVRGLEELTKRGIRSAVDRQRESLLLDTIKRHDTAVREAVEEAARADEMDQRTLSLYPSLVTHAQRSRDQVLIYGRKLSELRSLDFVDAEDTRPVDLILSAGGRGSRLIDRLTSFTFDKANGYIPVTPALTAFVQPRNAAQAASEAPVQSIFVRSVKVSAIVSASNESLSDVPTQDDSIRDALAAAVGQRIDHAVMNGANDGDHAVTGLLADGTAGTYPAAGVSYDALADAVARVETSGGIATGIFAHPKTAAAIRKTVDAARLSQLPELTVLPPLADGTPTLPEGTIVVLDAASVAMGIRKAFEVAGTDTMEEAFKHDQTFIAGRARIGGVHVSNAARVQVLTKAVA
ncbi:phage major capsid protein [Streptomyces sp. 147326]|uniref:phage major capsid family protein n=1 Tax=Streptomyces sp. 147326 TaxID=3074379 RepID=UPI0038573D5A